MAHRLLSALVTLAWGFWLGGMVMLFAAVGTIFTTPGFENDVRGAFAQRLFPVFEKMQLVFATIAILGTAAWWLAGRAKLKLALFTLFGLATVIAVYETTTITPKVQQLVADGQRGTPEFDRTHKLSTKVYTSGAVVLLIAGLLIPAAIRSDVTPKDLSPSTTPRTSGENPPA